MKLLYQGDVFSNYKKMGSWGRTGIYFVALGQIRELAKRDDIELYLYSSMKNVRSVREFSSDTDINVPVITEKRTPLRILFSSFMRFSDYMNFRYGKQLKGFYRVERWYSSTLRKGVGKDRKRFSTFDAFLSPCFPEPYAIRELGLNTNIVVHDMIPYRQTDSAERKRWWFRDTWICKLVEGAKANNTYFCISEYTRDEFMYYCRNADPDRVKVIYNGFNRKSGMLPCEENQKRLLGDWGICKGKYILILGAVVGHKNVSRQIAGAVRFIENIKSGLSSALSGQDVEHFSVVIVGRHDSTETILHEAGIAEADRELVLFLGYVDDEAIPVLYANAFCLSFTSLMEGFGLPVLEAMNCGCPVVTSNTTALPEVAGDAAMLINPEDTEAHAKAYEKIYRNPELRAELIRKGRINAARFSWENNIDEILGCIQANIEQ